MNYGASESASQLMANNAADTATSSDSWFLGSRLEMVMLVSVILDAMAGGIIFIFSNTILPSLATLDPEVAIKAMNTINVIIVNPLFVISFFGGLISGYPAYVMWKNPDEFSKPARYYAIAATLTFFFGEFLVTVTQNVPRNDALLVVDPESDDGVNYWEVNFLQGWRAWNTARCVFSMIASVFAGLSLCLMRKPSK